HLAVEIEIVKSGVLLHTATDLTFRQATQPHATALMFQHMFEPRLVPAAKEHVSANRKALRHQRSHATAVTVAQHVNAIGIDELNVFQRGKGIAIGIRLGVEVEALTLGPAAAADARLVDPIGGVPGARRKIPEKLSESILSALGLRDGITAQP